MNKIRELRFGKKTKPDVIDPTAYSRDGYLIHQGRLTDVRFGRKTSKESGCGWIASYNLLRYMGQSVDPLQVAYDLEGKLLWGGHIGSHPLAVWWYLHRRGFHFRVAVTRRGMERLVRCSAREHRGRVAGILAYIHKKGAHYTAFLREESSVGAVEELRFLNAVYGVENHRVTVGDFFERYVKVPLCFVIVAK